MDEKEKRKLVVETGKELLRTELVARTWGNISCRLDSDSFLITPSGLDYMQMSEDDIVLFHMESGEWEGKHRPSSEKRVHTAAYKSFDEVEFVIHTHQKYATALGLTGTDSLVITEDERKKLGGIGLASYGLSGTKKLSRAVTEVFDKGAKTVLMVHHGALICGRTKEEAMERAMLLEDICRRSIKGMMRQTITASPSWKGKSGMICGGAFRRQMCSDRLQWIYVPPQAAMCMHRSTTWHR